MKVILPGSYDPVTVGHLDLIRRASEMYEEVFAVIFVNPQKSYRFTQEERLDMLALATKEIKNVKVDFSDGLVIDYMRSNGIEKIVKGYRNALDLEYERTQAEWNKAHGGFETELLKSTKGLENVSSTAARAALCESVSTEGLLPEAVREYIRFLGKKD